MDHWVLFDTLSNDQVTRLKKVIDQKIEPAAVRAGNTTAAAATPSNDGPTFLSMLEAETAKLEK
jgi:hypothetical protein